MKGLNNKGVMNYLYFLLNFKVKYIDIEYKYNE